MLEKVLARFVASFIYIYYYYLVFLEISQQSLVDSYERINVTDDSKSEKCNMQCQRPTAEQFVEAFAVTDSMSKCRNAVCLLLSDCFGLQKGRFEMKKKLTRRNKIQGLIPGCIISFPIIH